VNELKLTATSHTPMRTKVLSQSACNLFVPLEGGGNKHHVNGSYFTLDEGDSAIFCPESTRLGESGYRSVLIFDVDKFRLERTISTMGGEDCQFVVNFSDPRSLPLRRGGFAFDSFSKKLCNVVDSFVDNPRMLEHMQLDETFYRAMALLFFPQLHSGEDCSSKLVKNKSIQTACQYIMANLHKEITLTDIENAAELSQRALQYGFLKTFDKSPMRWVRDQRFLLARSLLSKARPEETVQSIIYSSCNFLHASQFSAGYKERFGELPSQTLAKSPYR
jgi:AraC-like DNA-binding protein